MRKTLIAALLPCLLALRTSAAAPADNLTSTFGPEVLKTLHAKGYVILQGKPDAYRLQDVHWKSLAELAIHSEAALDLEQALTRLKAGEPISEAESPSFLALAKLPAEGIVTPDLHGLIAALAGYHSDWLAAAGGPVPLPETPKSANLFETPWGQAFAARTHADVIEDPLSLAKPFFETVFSGPKPEPKAREHFLEYIKMRYQTDAAPTLSADARAAMPSEELRAWIRKYLADQRRLIALKRLKQAADLLQRRASKELAALLAVAKVFHAKPGLIAKLEGLPKAAAEGSVKLKSTGPHLQPPAKLGQFELGDSAIVSSGYWVDGLEEGKSADFEETTYAGTDRGFYAVETSIVSRSNGGPYALSRKIALMDSRSFTLHLVVSGETGASIADAQEVPVSSDFETALRKAAAADQEARSCNLKEAETAYAAVAQLIAEPAKEKSQYKDLLASISARRQDAAKGAAALVKLEEAVAAARPDASPDACAYKPLRTEAAIKALRALPPGCDSLLPELDKQAAIIQRRSSDQENFAKAAAAGVKQRSDCAFSLSLETLVSGLALLDADPAARCGATDKLAKKVEEDIPAVRSEQLWGAAFDEQLTQAQAEPSPKAKLAGLTQLISRINSLPTTRCFSRQLAKAQDMARKAGEDLGAPEGEKLEPLMAADKTAAQTNAEVAAERGKLTSEMEALQARKAEEQTPATVPTTSVPSEAPAPAKVVAAKGPKGRLECLEAGFKSSGGKTVDCNGADFNIVELKTLREKLPKAGKPAHRNKTRAKKG